MDICWFFLDLDEVSEVPSQQLVHLTRVKYAVLLPEGLTECLVAVYDSVQNLLLKVLPDPFGAACLEIDLTDLLADGGDLDSIARAALHKLRDHVNDQDELFSVRPLLCHDSRVQVLLQLDYGLLLLAYLYIRCYALGVSCEHLIVCSHTVNSIDEGQQQFPEVPEEKLDALLDHLGDKVGLLVEYALSLGFFLRLHLENVLIEYSEDFCLHREHIDLLHARLVDLQYLVDNRLLELEHLQAHKERDSFLADEEGSLSELGCPVGVHFLVNQVALR